MTHLEQNSGTRRQNRPPLFEEAVALFQSGSLAEAQGAIRAFLAHEPRHAQALHLMGIVLSQQGDFAEGLRFIDAALQIEPESAFTYNSRANVLIALKRFDEALAAFEAAIGLNPNYVVAFANRGNAYLELGRFNDAVASYDKAIALNPDDAETFYGRGCALQELKRFDEAIASYDKAIALRPDYTEAFCNRGAALQALERHSEAATSYDRAVALKPDFPEAWCSRGNAFQALKRFDEALASYDKAIALKPDFAEAYDNRGVALKEMQRLDEAVDSYEKAIALKPDLAEAFHNRSVALRELGRLHEALASCDRASELKPDLADALHNRSTVLRELGRLDEALASCNRAVAARPNSPEAFHIKGVVLRQLGRLDEASASLETALALRSDFATALNDMGNVLKDIGQLQRAQRHYEQAAQLDPNMAAAYLNLADLKKFAPGDAHLAGMEALAAKAGGLSKKDRMQLDFALGKAYADLKNYPRSFTHLLAGNAAKRATINYDETAVFALYDRIEAVVTRDLIAQKSGYGSPSRLPIFVLGMPRSGTTLIEQIIASHPMVRGAGELDTFKKAVSAVRGPYGWTAVYPEFLLTTEPEILQQIGERYIAELRKLAPADEHVTDKMPSNYYFVGLIHLALPNAKIIHSVRNPLDTCISCFSKLFSGEQNHTYDLVELGHYYRRYERLMAHWHHVLPPQSILDVRYEDVIADLEGQARRIIDYCGLPWDPRCLAFHETDRPVLTASATQVRQPIYNSAVDRWRVYSEYLEPLFRALALEKPRVPDSDLSRMTSTPLRG